MQVYTLHDPDTGALRYIGITKLQLKERLWEHLKYKGRDHRGHWIRSLQEKQQRPMMKLLHVACDKSSACILERFFIASARYFSFALVNSTAGGEGVFSPSEETLRKRSIAIRQAKGTPEARALAAERAKQRWADPAFRARMAQSKKDPEYLRRISQASSQAGLRPEVKAKFAARMKANWADPSYKERVLATRRETKYGAP